MSVIFLADGDFYSSKAFPGGSLSLPSIKKHPHRHRSGGQSVEGDAGWSIEYETGTYRRTFNLQWLLLSNDQKVSIERFFKALNGKANWFSLQLPDWPDEHWTSIFTQDKVGGSTTIIEDASAFDTPNITDGLKGLYVYVLSGINQGYKRKIDTHTPGSQAVVDPAFPNSVAQGVSLRLAYPVKFETEDVVCTHRHPLFWDVQLRLIEKVSS